MSRWNLYYDKVGEKPNSFIVYAITRYARKKGYALDLGAGNLRDSKFLLQFGFQHVTAVERDSDSLRFQDPKIDLQVMPIEEYAIEQKKYDCVISCNVLFFLNNKEVIAKLFHNVWRGLKPQGIFACNLLGINDEWVTKNSSSDIVCFTAYDVGVLMTGFEILVCREIEEDGTTTMNQNKHWHTWSLVLRKLLV